MEVTGKNVKADIAPGTNGLPAIPPPPPELSGKRCTYGILVTDERKDSLVKSKHGQALDNGHNMLKDFDAVTVVRSMAGFMHFPLPIQDIHRRSNRQECLAYAQYRMSNHTGEWVTIDYRWPNKRGEPDAFMKEFEEAIGLKPGESPRWYSWF